MQTTERFQNTQSSEYDWLIPVLPRSRSNTRADFDSSISLGALGAATARTFEQDQSGRMFVTIEDDPWATILADTIELWANNPAIFEEEGLEAPSPETLQKASSYAKRMKLGGLVAPDRIVMDAAGGILFELENLEEGVRVVLHFWDEGDVELQTFRGSKLVDRFVMSTPDNLD